MMTFPAIVAPIQSLRLGIRNRLVATFTCTRALVRGLPLFLADRPATPLRVLCVIALDAAHELRCAKQLTRETVRQLSLALDYAATVNAIIDNKSFDSERHDKLLDQLTRAGRGDLCRQYLKQLRDLECHRPAIHGPTCHFPVVCRYREAVVDLSMRFLMAIIRHQEPEADDLNDCYPVLCSTATLCQVIDDVVDYPRDLAAGLPGYLTATRRMSESVSLTRRYVRELSQPGKGLRTARNSPLRQTLRGLGILALSVLLWRSWWPATAGSDS